MKTSRDAKRRPDTWANRLFLALQEEEEPIPKDFYSADWYSKTWGITLSHARRLLYRGISKGLVERRMFRKSNSLGFPRKASFFRFMDAKGKKTPLVKT